MELSEILNSLSSSGTGAEKTASHSTGGSLSEAIDRALDYTTEKTASHSSNPQSDLIKIASDLATAEQDALIKEAHIYGMAVADGFASRMSSYQTAKYNSSSAGNETIKEAMELGYLHASTALSRNSQAYQNQNVKVASQHYGKEEAVKVASYLQGKEEAVKVASYLQGKEEAVKVASYLQGQEEAVKVASELTKIASSYEDFGFQVGNSILRKL